MADSLEDVGVRAVVEGIGPYERNAKKVQKAQQRMGDSAVKAAKQSGFLSKALGQVASTAGGFLVAQGVMAIPRLLGGITSTARDLELQMKKANIVFGEQIDVVTEWAKTNAKAMGLSASAATNLAARFGDILIPMGFARDVAAEMSTEVVGLAGALSEWSGGQRTAAEVADVLAKAMTGEREALKGLGVVITEADISARMAANGFVDLAGAQLQQARATVTQQLIFEKSTDAQTAYAEGAGSAARQQAELSAEMAEAKEVLSLALTPALLAATGAVTRYLVPALKAGASGMERFISASGGVVGVVKENKDLIIAFGAVALGAVLIPQLVRAVSGLWSLFTVLRAIAIARHINMLQVVIQSLAMPTIGLPALAVGAAVAGIALFGLARHFGRAKSAADLFREAEVRVNEELKETARLAALDGLDQGAAELRNITSDFFALEERLVLLREADELLTKQFQRSLPEGIGPVSDASKVLAARLAEVRERIAETAAAQDVWRGKAEDLLPTMEDLIQVSHDTGIPLATMVALYGQISTSAEAAGQSVDEFAVDSVDLTKDADNLGKALDGVVKSLGGIRSEISKLLGVETKEEAALRLQISARELTIARATEWVRALQRDLTPAEEEHIAVIEAEIDALEGQLDIIGLTKDVTEDYAVVLNRDLLPSLEDVQGATEGVVTAIGEQDTKSHLAAIRAAILTDAITKLREMGMEPAAEALEERLLPDLERLAGIEIETEVEVDTARAERMTREFIALLDTVEPEVSVTAQFLGALGERDILSFKSVMEDVPDELAVTARFYEAQAEQDVRGFLTRLQRTISSAWSLIEQGTAFTWDLIQQRVIPEVGTTPPPADPLGFRDLQGRMPAGDRAAQTAGGGQPVSVTVNAPISFADQTDWAGVRRAAHAEVDVALDNARSQALRSGAPLRPEIG